MWHDPERYLAIFAEGRVPTAEDSRLDEKELRAGCRTQSPPTRSPR